MQETLWLKAEPISINEMYHRNRSFKTKKYKDWSYQVFHQLNFPENMEKLQKLRNFFDSKKHAYFVSVIHFMPKDILITKEGKMSSRAKDITNIEKGLIDCIFNPSNFGQDPPYSCENLNTDDKVIQRIISQKIPFKDYYIKIDLKIDKIIKTTADLELPQQDLQYLNSLST